MSVGRGGKKVLRSRMPLVVFGGRCGIVQRAMQLIGEGG